MRRLFFTITGLLFLIPLTVFGAEFSSQALFLSKTPVQEGETVLIHAVVANDDDGTFKGEVRYRAADTSLGVVPVTLDAGEARTVSLSWTPEAGTYAITVELRSDGGVVAASEQARFSVEPKPNPAETTAPTEETAVESSQPIQAAIANVSPSVAEHSVPVFTAIDSARNRGAQFLDDQITQAKENLEERAVLGAATGTQESKGSETFWKVFQTLYLYLLTLLREVLATAFYFYPLLVVGFLYLLWRLYRRMSAR